MSRGRRRLQNTENLVLKSLFCSNLNSISGRSHIQFISKVWGIAGSAGSSCELGSHNYEIGVPYEERPAVPRNNEIQRNLKRPLQSGLSSRWNWYKHCTMLRLTSQARRHPSSLIRSITSKCTMPNWTRIMTTPKNLEHYRSAVVECISIGEFVA